MSLASIGAVEWFLPNKTTVTDVELAAPQFIRASRAVLAAPAYVLGGSGGSKKRTLRTAVGGYRLSRLVRLEPIMAAAQSNWGPYRPHMYNRSVGLPPKKGPNLEQR